MSNVQRLIESQNETAKRIERKRDAYPSLATEKKTSSKVKEMLAELDREVQEFINNHDELVNSTELDGDHQYFSSNFFDVTMEIVTSYKEKLQETLAYINNLLAGKQPSTSTSMGSTRSARGATNPHASIGTPSSTPTGRTTDNLAEFNQPNHGTTAAPVGQNINMANNETIVSNIERNLNLAMGKLDQKLNEFLFMNLHDVTEADIKVLRRTFYEEWQAVKALNATVSNMSHTYDITSYMDLQEKIEPVLHKHQISETTMYGTRNHKEDILKMPRINMPKFDGDYLKWKSFKLLFDQMIGTKQLTNAEKMMYLRSNVQGTAMQLIRNLDASDGNYQEAWDILNARYDNDKLISNAIYERFISTEQVKETPESVRKFIDDLREAMSQMKTLGTPIDGVCSQICHYMAVKRLDNRSSQLYLQETARLRKPPQMEQLLQFMDMRFQMLRDRKTGDVAASTNEGKSNAKPKNVRSERPKRSSTALISTKNDSQKCDCGEKHFFFQCPKFLALDPNERYKVVKNKNLCANCLKPNHMAKNCNSRSCGKCSKKHNTLLHFETRNALIGSAINNENFEHIFLATVLINVMDKYGNPIKLRALLDSGSQLNIMTDKAYRKLGINGENAEMKIEGIGASAVQSNKRSILQLGSLHSSFKTKLEFFIVNKLTTCQPAHHVEISKWKMPTNIELADPKFNVPASVDMIIGGEIFYRLMSKGLKSIGKNLPDVQNTVFGWVVIGKLLGLEQNNAFVGITSQAALEKQLTKFWNIEEKFKPSSPYTELEQNCERFFSETTKRDQQGRFVVKLQFIKEPTVLGDSELMARRRFTMLERKFTHDAELKKDYVQFMSEYENLGHMERVNRSQLGSRYYMIPHHAVRNPASSTTKFRVVFDASAKTTSNISLNEILANGPMLQDDLFTIMVRFRKHKYVFSADITKMYRQIKIDPEDQKWQVILWRQNPADDIQYFKLKTVTYGTTCASYLAIKTLQQLANESATKYPLASTVAKRDFNVDDIMTGTDDIFEAQLLQKQLIEMLQQYGFELHKWCANHKELQRNIPREKQEVCLDINSEKTETKALGMKWIPSTDMFMLHYQQRQHDKITKRTVLSETAQLFDPLGLVNPVIVLAKIFIQELWANKLDWDTPVPEDMRSKWINFRQELRKLNHIKIPRRLLVDLPINIQLHAFSDASTRAYGTAVYIRSESKNGQIQVNLVCSKSRVAPVDQTTLPRLELCGSVTMVEIAEKLQNSMGIKFDSVTYWTDSEIVLSWINTDGTYKTFVANRIARINRKTSKADWRYINTKLNPADLISRGVLPETLLKSDLWWHGPQFLRMDQKQWPTAKAAYIREEIEERTVKTVLTVKGKDPHFISQIKHRNSIQVLQRVVAYCMRIRKVKNNETIAYELSVDELKQAMIQIIKYCQNEALSEEIDFVKNGTPQLGKFNNFVPIIDADGILRVGGRLHQANVPFEQKHPAILPKDHYITRLIMEQIHKENMHNGPQALLAATRQKYWPENGKLLAKSVVHRCILCSRAKPKLMEQLMGNLPAERVNISRPFIHTGLDFAGPITIHHKVRGKQPTTAYACIFVCFTTKAVHIEAAVDLSTDAFICCLKRFIARRGLPAKIFCDNATNFKGASNQLYELAELMQDEAHQKQVIRYCQDRQIEWKFMPARSPHFGGLHEAAVKSAKLHLRKILHAIYITFEELATILTEIEAILNSRPLTPMSNDPSDLEPLTAGHFLIGQPLNCMNDENLVETSKTKMWSKIRYMQGIFWDRWSKEYLSELQNRNKWTKGHDNVKVGTLVILRNENYRPLQWKMARVTKTFPDQHNIVRAVEVLAVKGPKDSMETILLRRAIHEISPLPVSTDLIEPDMAKTVELSQQTTSSSTSNLKNKSGAVARAKQAPPQKFKIKRSSSNSKKLLYDDEPVAYRTRSSAKAYPTVMVMLIAFLTVIVSIIGEPCNITTFQHNPGLYFEETGQLALTNDEWNIACVMKMENYWIEGDQIQIILDKLDEICPELGPDHFCEVTRKQLRHQARMIISKNELIRGFALTIISRKRRGWIDGIGWGAKTVFGVLDEADATHYEQELEKLHQDNRYLQKLVANQTTLLEITQNIIRKDETGIAKQLHQMQNEIASWDRNDQRHMTSVFSALSVQALALIAGYRETQRAIIDLITHVHHGKVPTTLVSPSQLAQQLIIISKNLPSNLMVPGDNQRASIAELYSIMTAQVRITGRNLVIRVKVPIINREVYRLHHIIPVPFHHEGQLVSITSTNKYIGTNIKQDHYYMLSAHDKAECKPFIDQLIICQQHEPLLNTQGGEAICEMAILTHAAKGISPKCQIAAVNTTQQWIKLEHQNQFLFTVNKPSNINLLCDANIQTCSISESGIIAVKPQCIVQSGNMEITAYNVHTSSVPVVVVPALNISSEIKQLDQSKVIISPEDTSEYTARPELDQLENLIINQRLSENAMNTFNIHHAHHYVMSYIIVIAAVTIGIWIFIRRRQRRPSQTSHNRPAEILSWPGPPTSIVSPAPAARSTGSILPQILTPLRRGKIGEAETTIDMPCSSVLYTASPPSA